jgi:MFS family permease
MKQYLQLLHKKEVLKRLSLIQLIAYFGAWFSNVAIYTLLISFDVSAKIIAFVAMLHFLSGVVQAPLTGAIIDKVAPKKLMLFLIVVQIVATFGLLFIDTQENLWLLYILVFFKMAAASFYFTAEMSLLPRILDGKDLQLANELHSIIWSLSYTVGMALSGYFVYLFGVKMAFSLDGVLFCIAFIILLQTKLHVDVVQQAHHLLGMMKETIVYLKKEPLVLHLMFIHAFVGFTAFDALVALLVDNFYQTILAASLSLGLLHSFRALGLVVGPMVLSNWISKNNLTKLFIFEAIAIGVWSVVMENFYLSLALSIFVGFFTTTLWSYTYTLIQKNTQEQFYGRIVAYNDMLFLSVASFTSYMIGFLAEKGWELPFIGYAMGAMFLIGAIYYAIIYKKYKIKG